LTIISVTMFAQNFARMERNLSNQSGDAYFKDAIAIFDNYYGKSSYPDAQKLAIEATRKAKKTNNKKWLAVSLNREAKALLRMPNRIVANRNVAEQKLRESIALTNDKKLHRADLKLLREIAYARGKFREKKDIDQEIAIFEGKEVEDSGGGLGNLFGKKRREAEDKAAGLEVEKAAIAAQKEELTETVDALEYRQVKLRQQKANLAGRVAAKEAAIQLMNEEQVRSEFMILEQRRLVDSMSYASNLDFMRLANQEMKNDELASQLSLEKTQRNFLIALIGCAILTLIGLFLRFMGMKAHNKVLEEKNRIIEEERKRSEELLLNILPKIVADELKSKGAANAKRFDNATVLFTDFKNFTNISKKMTPEELVKDLDYCFKAFDKIIEKYGLEKIKTIGDSYMCAGGLPTGSNSKAKDVVRAALEIQDFLAQWKLERVASNQPFFEARIGIHTGPIVAGVVGNKKFAYDIWGSTVNVASRMETGGEIGKVNVSATTFNLIKEEFECEHRGKLIAKNYGEVDMYFVRKPLKNGGV
jgi:adenylate cyclase